ncbi:MAG TPA: hypothetical protein PK299_13890 [Anaerolineales bacterium]|nr:hypothetical protein [Anaerolineales bacterium]
MFAEKLIIEFLSADGTIQTSIIEDERGENLLVDYAMRKKGKESWAGPYLILSDNQDRIKRKLVPQTQLNPRDFSRVGDNEFAFRQEWINIHFKESYSLGLYALAFPQYAHILHLEVQDPYKPSNQLRRNVIKDIDDRRYFLLLELHSENRTASFIVRSRFLINKRTFLSETFTDSKYEMFGHAMENSGFREFVNAAPRETVVHQDSRQYNFSSSNIGQVSTGDNSGFQNDNSKIVVGIIQHPQSQELKLSIDELLKKIPTVEGVADYRKKDATESIGKVTQELSKPQDEQDKGYVKYYWKKVMEVLKDVAVVAGLIQTISKLLGVLP